MATIFQGGESISCDYHDKTKIPTITCKPLTGTKQIQTPVKSSLKQQPHSKGHKRVAITEPREI
jgi:hypothetical protein